METDSENSGGIKKTVVVFYDCCVPQNHIAAVISKFPPAEHIFVSNVFGMDVCMNDRDLFAEVWENSRQKYPEGLIFFVTIDRDFWKEIEGLEAVGKVKIVLMESTSCVSFETARLRVEAALQKVFSPA